MSEQPCSVLRSYYLYLFPMAVSIAHVLQCRPEFDILAKYEIAVETLFAKVEERGRGLRISPVSEEEESSIGYWQISAFASLALSLLALPRYLPTCARTD